MVELVETRLAVLGDVVEQIVRANPGKLAGDTFSYVDLGSVDQRRKIIDTEKSVATSEAPSRARQVLKSNDVLVSTVRPNLNGVARVPGRLDGSIASTGFCVLRPRAGQLDPNYLFHWVQSPVFIDGMVRKASGASYPAVSDKIVLGSYIPLPPLEEQRRIAAILDKADELRTKRRQALAHLDALTQTIFHSMFGDLTNEQHIPLRDAVAPGTIVTYGIVQAGDEYPSGVPYVRTGDIRNGRIVLEGLRRTNPTIAAKFARSRIAAGDIVMSIRATVGTVALTPQELDGANLTQGTARIAPGLETETSYLLEYLRTPRIQQWIQKQVKGATFKEITLDRLRQLPVSIPRRADQLSFGHAVSAVEKLKVQHRAQLSDLEILFASLQHRAYKGEL